MEAKITNDMTVAQALALIGVDPDTDYITKGRALAKALGGDQAFEDWIVNGVVSPEDTVGQIWDDWNAEA